jgi:hypothetical protein
MNRAFVFTFYAEGSYVRAQALVLASSIVAALEEWTREHQRQAEPPRVVQIEELDICYIVVEPPAGKRS